MAPPRHHRRPASLAALARAGSTGLDAPRPSPEPRGAAPRARLFDEARSALAEASALARTVETVGAAYAALEHLRGQRAALARALEAERARLGGRSALVAGALRALEGPAFAEPAPSASTPSAATLALTPGGELATAVSRALARLAVDEAEHAAHAVQLERELLELARARLAHRLAAAPPTVELVVRGLPGERQVLHLRRPAPHDAAPLLFALAGRIPTRADFLADDSTDDVLLPPPLLYPDEGLSPAAVRPSLPELASLLLPRALVWPLKACLFHGVGALRSESSPAAPPASGTAAADPAAPQWVLWRTRGAVLEAELLGPSGPTSLLPRAGAELVVATLLARAREGRLRLQLADD